MFWCRWVRRVSKKYASLMFEKLVSCAGMIVRHIVGILAYWKSKNHNRLAGGTQQRLLCRKKENHGIPINRQPHHHALLHRWQAKNPCLPLKIAKNLFY
jgi:hypothetical protein